MAELALAAWAFLAATLFPLSSEVAFIAAITNDMPLLHAMFFASLGNVLGICVNYFFGYWLYEKTKVSLSRSKTGQKSLEYGHRYGYAILPFTFLPVIGDPLTLVAGVLRLNFWIFLFFAALFRIGRYYAIFMMVGSSGV